jgi:FkbM family methyltransferase
MKKISLFKNNLHFQVSNDLEIYRVESMLEKEAETIAWIKAWSKESNQIYFDIGANIGIYSLFACYCSGSNAVFSFEPVASNFIALQQNINCNNFKNIHPFNISISDHSKMTSLFLSDDRVGNSGAQVNTPINELGEEFAPKSIEKVLCLSVDDLVSRFNFPVPNFIKIDVDGHEQEIINGMEKTIKNKNIKSILIEFNNKNQFNKYRHFFEKSGLILDTSFDDLPNHSSKRRAESGGIARNYIFTRDKILKV